MPKLKSSTAATKALIGIWTVLLTSFIILTLYFARSILIPMALAALLTFLLAPLVTSLQRYVGRIGAVLLVVALILSAAATAGWVLTSQVVDLAEKLPDYKENIQTKLRSFRMPTGGRFTRFSATVEELKQELTDPKKGQTNVAASSNGPTFALDPVPALDPSFTIVPPPAPPNVVAVPVPSSENSTNNPLRLIRAVLAPLLGPIGTAALVLLLVIFMLLKREDLRSRMIRLIGQGRISATTRAMDDAGARVTRYLLMQLIVNVTYGIPVAVGLYFIGVPNALLWGALASVLRFIPYVGPWIGASLPIALSLAVSPGWTMPLLTIALFVALELLSNNVMEPWLYGSSTGVTPIALIFAALFWTWLWGPVGLVLATPMTVCLVVMGRHIPSMSFLSILLSDEEALTPAQDFYYRLLTVGDQDEIEFVEKYLKVNPLASLYDSVLLPVITAVEIDHSLNRLDDEQKVAVEQIMRDIVVDLGARPLALGKASAEPDLAAIDHTILPAEPVFCLPARAERDELAGIMLMQLLQQQDCNVRCAPPNLPIEDLIALVEKSEAETVCISVVSPSTVLHARYLCLKLRAQLPEIKIVVGLWGATEGVAEATRRVQDSGADEVITTFTDAMARFTRPTPPADKIRPAGVLSVAALADV